MNTEELHLLSAAYALDALDGEDLAAFETHLADCADCTAEVREFGETASRLGVAVATPAPAMLRARVLARIAVTRQLPPLPAPETAREQPGATSAAVPPGPPGDVPADDGAPAAGTVPFDGQALDGAAVLSMRGRHSADFDSGPRVHGPVDLMSPPPGRRPFRPWPGRAVAAVAASVLLAATAGGLTVRLQRQVDQLRMDQAATAAEVREARARQADVTTVLTSPDRRLLDAALPGNGRATVVVAGDRAVVLSVGVPGPGAGKGYQLWVIGADRRPQSAGMMHQDQEQEWSAFVPNVAGAQKVALSVEPASGSPQPTTTPLLVVSLPTGPPPGTSPSSTA